MSVVELDLAVLARMREVAAMPETATALASILDADRKPSTKPRDRKAVAWLRSGEIQ